MKIRCYRWAIAAIVVGILPSAQAQLQGNLLLRQATFARGYVNQIFSDQPQASTGMGSLVSTSEAWNIANIQTFQLQGAAPNNWYGNVNTATLNVTRQVGGVPDPAIDPTVTTNTGPTVVYSGFVNVVLDNGLATANGPNQIFRMTADTSGIAALQNLAAGDYVFSLVANTTLAVHGRSFTAQSTLPGTSSDYTRNPGGGFNLGGLGSPANSQWLTMTQAFPPSGPNANWAIGINGSPVPEPTTMAALGLGALAIMRRRRRNKA